ncbi:hypothetical protein [Halocola ammonii]
MKQLVIIILTVAWISPFAQNLNKRPPDIVNPNHSDDNYELIEINLTPCGNALLLDKEASKAYNDSLGSNSVEHIHYSRDTIFVQTRIVEECCLSFIGDVKSSSTQINLQYQTQGIACSCICCYGLQYVLIQKGTIPKDSIKVLINDVLPDYGLKYLKGE